VDSAVAAAWEKVFAEAAVDDLEAHEADGWMTVQGFAQKSNMSRPRAEGMLKKFAADNRMEMKKIRAKQSGITREMNIFRPRI
jgi:hypothetical protein